MGGASPEAIAAAMSMAFGGAAGGASGKAGMAEMYKALAASKQKTSTNVTPVAAKPVEATAASGQSEQRPSAAPVAGLATMDLAALRNDWRRSQHEIVVQCVSAPGGARLVVLPGTCSGSELYQSVRRIWRVDQGQCAMLYLAKDAAGCNRGTMVADSMWQEDVDSIAQAAVAAGIMVSEGEVDGSTGEGGEGEHHRPVPRLLLRIGADAHHRVAALRR